jgi:hypothetical protein
VIVMRCHRYKSCPRFHTPDDRDSRDSDVRSLSN